MGGLSERASHLLQGGLPLPGVFHGMLSAMLENGRAIPGYTLTKIVRDRLENLHKERVLTYWGSWENLTGDLLEEMESRGLVTGEAGIWTLTEKVQEGARVRPMAGIRVTAMSQKATAEREAFAYARARAMAYRAFLEERGIFTGKVRRTFEQHQESLVWEGEKEIDPPPPRRKRGVVADFTREYLISQYPRWVTGKEVAEAFNESHPQDLPIRPSSAWNRMQQLVWTGKADRKDGQHPGPGRSHTMFRWKTEEEE